MNKVMRKYNKWILAVLGVVLMVTFLVQGTAQMFRGDPGTIVRATMGNKKIIARDLGLAEAEYRFLRDFAPNVVRGALGVESAAHWYLLSHEASEAGLVGGAPDGAGFVGTLADYEGGMRFQQYRNIPQLQQMIEQQMAQIAQAMTQGKSGIAAQAGLREQDADLALAKLRGVMRLVKANNLAGARMSDRLATVGMKRFEDAVIADLLDVPASRLIDSMPKPTDDELRAQYEKYRAIEASESEDGMGYVLPPRVKLEWIGLDKAVVAGAVTLDPIAVNKEYLADRKKYPGEFAAEREKIQKEMTDRRVAQVFDEAERAVKGAVRTALRGVPDEGVFKALPAGWKRPTTQSLAEAIVHAVKTATGIDLPVPAVQVRESWLTQEEVRQLPGIGTASIRMGTRPTPVAEMIFAVRELAPERASGLQVGVPFITAPTADLAENRYYWVVTAAKAKGPAESLDEVRAKVEQDVRTLKAMEKLTADAPAYQALAISEGLEAVAKQFDQPGVATLGVQRNVKITRMSASPSNPVTTDKTFVEAIFGVAAGLDPLLPPTPENAVQRTIAVPVPKAKSLAVVQITQVRPLTLERVRTLDEGRLLTLRYYENEDLKLKGENPFSYEALKARWSYKPVREDEEPASEGESEKKGT